MIAFWQATKRFADGTVAVDSLDLVVEAGKITVLVGPSGCGKTTSLRMVNRMVAPTSGTVIVNGVDVRRADPAALRRGIGYVIQHVGLFPHRTVLDNVGTVPLLCGTSRRSARARARELLELVGLPGELAGRYPAQLSGGQQQRVGVARALAADPPVLLMDEPFSAVDPVVRASLQDELLRLQSQLGKTILFVTHDVDEAIKLGDTVAVLRTGGVLAQHDTPAALLIRPADEFVASFVGRDRGYRALGFLRGDRLSLRPMACVPLGAPLRQAREVAGGGWALVVDGQRRPVGWLAADRMDGDGTVSADLLLVVGSRYQVDAQAGSGSLRSALDAALSSPSGQGIAVDAVDAVVGSVTADDVLDALAATRRSGSIPGGSIPGSGLPS